MKKPRTAALLGMTASLIMGAASSSLAAAYSHDTKVIEELRMRDGLPNLYKKLNAAEPATIVYLGGSITHAEGWRPKTFEWLQEQYPKAALTHVDAAVPGTGADFAACRLERDVLAHEPDLVFIEYRVNMGGGVEARAIDGLVQRIWAADPETDICFVYTVAKWMLKGMEDGGQQYAFGKIMEKTANYYGIPSIDLAPEVLKQKKAGTLTFQSPKPIAGQLVFSKDGVHPVDAGYEVYKTIIARSMTAMKEVGTAGPHALLPALEVQTLTTACFLPLSVATSTGNWQPVDATTDAIYLDNEFRTGKMLDAALRCNDVGATITIPWTGTRLTLTHIPQGDDMQVSAVTDGGNAVAIDCATERPVLFARFDSQPELAQGDHTTVITIEKMPAGKSFYIGQCLLLRDAK